MAINYTESTRAYRRGKSNVTRARNKGDWAKVIQVCDDTLAAFDKYGWPDDWAHFERAKYDATIALRLRSF